MAANDVLSHFRVTADTEGAAAPIKGLGGIFSSVFGSIAGGVAVGTMAAGAITAVGGALVGAAKSAIGFVTDSIAMNATLQTTTLQFETLMGSADAAREHVKFLFEFAKKTPFETQPIITASKHLQVFGGAALNTQKNLTLFGDAAAAVQQPINEISMWSGRMYAALQAGKPFGEAAMRLGEMGVMGPKVRAELEAMQKQGKSGAEIWARYQQSLEQFGGAMEKQAGTWSGLTSTLSDTIKMLAATAFGPFFEMAQGGLSTIVDLLGSKGVESAVKNFGAAGMAAFNAVSDALEPLGEALYAAVKGFLDTADSQSAATTAAKILVRWIAQVTDNWGHVVGAVQAVGKAYFGLLGIGAKVQIAFGQIVKSILEGSIQIADALAAVSFGPMSQRYREGADMIRGALGVVETGIANATDRQKTYSETWDKYGAVLSTVQDQLHGAADRMRENADRLTIVDSSARSSSSALDLLGDSFDGAGGSAKKSKEQISDFAKTTTFQLAELLKEWSKQPASIRSNSESIAILMEKYAALRARVTNLSALPAELEALFQQYGKVLDAQQNLIATFAPFAATVQPAIQGVNDLTNAWAAYPAAVKSTLAIDREKERTLAEQNRLAGAAAREGIKDLAQSLTQLSQVAGDSFGSVLRGLAQIVTAIDTVTAGVGSIRDGFKQLGTSGGGIMGTIGGITSIASGVIGIVTSVASLVKGWFGVSEEVKRARSTLEAFQETLRGSLTDQQKLEAQGEGWRMDVIRVRDAYLAVGKTAEEADAIVRQLWDTDHPERSKRAIEEINRVLKEQQQITDDLARKQREYTSNMQAAADVFGASAETMGQRFAQARINETAQKYVDALNQLREGGGDIGGVLLAARDEISKLVQDSMKFGTTLPANIREFVDELARSNLLVDEFGNTITDTSKLKWAEELTADTKDVSGGMADLTKSVDDSGDALLRSKMQWSEWGEEALLWARRVRDEVDGISFGKSPGGIKEWAPMLRGAMGAFRQFGSVAVAELSDAQRAINDLTGRSLGFAGGIGSVVDGSPVPVAAAGGAANIVFEHVEVVSTGTETTEELWDRMIQTAKYSPHVQRRLQTIATRRQGSEYAGT